MVGSILTKQSEMVSADQTFSACTSNSQNFPILNGLGDVPIAVTKICGLRTPQMYKAFGRAIQERLSVAYNTSYQVTYNPIALAKSRKPLSVSTPLELRPEMTTWSTSITHHDGNSHWGTIYIQRLSRGAVAAVKP